MRTVAVTSSKTPVGTRDRSERVVMGVTGLLGIVFAVLALRWVSGFEVEFGRLAQAEARGLAAWQTIVAESQAGKLNGAQTADRIEGEVLPVWREARGLAERLAEGRWDGRISPRIPEALRLREEAWTAMAAAGRGDQAAGRRAEEAWRAADRIVIELRRGEIETPGAR